MTCVIDTHGLVWFLEGDAKLSRAGLAALQDPTNQLVVPTIVLAEIAHLYGRKRITLDLPKVFAHLTSASNCVVYPLDEDVIQRLPVSLEIHDGIIVATALVYRDFLGENVAVVTKDSAIRSSGLIPVIW